MRPHGGGAKVDVVNTTSKEVYEQLYPQYFTGSQPFDVEGTMFTVSWDVKEAPVFDLTPPPSLSEAALRAHLTEGPTAGRMAEGELAEHVAALRASLDGSTFQVRLDQVHIKVDSGDGNPVEEDVAVTVDVQASTSDTGLFSLNPFKATSEAPSKVDKIFLDKVVLPNVLDESRKVLSGITLPAPQIPGLALSTPVPVIQPQQAVAALNLAEHGTPQPPFPDSWPQSPFFALLGRDAVERIAQVATTYLEGKPFHAERHQEHRDRHRVLQGRHHHPQRPVRGRVGRRADGARPDGRLRQRKRSASTGSWAGRPTRSSTSTWSPIRLSRSPWPCRGRRSKPRPWT
ncbi:hypothetical protein GCM10020000_03450 [Streptomyces olivoverticillatus]